MIRSAEFSDYKGIVAIRNALALDVLKLDNPQYVAEVEQNGFLLPVGTPQSDFGRSMADYIISEIDGKVAGFLRLDDKQEMTPDEIPHWATPEMEATYWGTPHASIGKIAVAPTMAKRGIAGAMLAEAEQRVKTWGISHLFSFIVTCEPPTNHPSIGFHVKNGFQAVASLEPQTAYGIRGYIATLYGKELV